MSVLQSVDATLDKCECENIVEYCQSHITLLWIWKIYVGKRLVTQSQEKQTLHFTHVTNQRTSPHPHKVSWVAFIDGGLDR